MTPAVRQFLIEGRQKVVRHYRELLERHDLAEAERQEPRRRKRA